LEHDTISVHFHNIAAYLARLEQDYGLNISVHSPGKYFWNFNELGEYRIHRVPFCMSIKGELATYSYCAHCQRMVIASFVDNPKPRFAQCVFGVEEYVIPILCHGTPLGFISVTGYSTDKTRTYECAKQRFERLREPLPDLTEGIAALKEELPDPEMLNALLLPIADLIGFLFMRIPRWQNKQNFTCAYITEYIELHYDEPLSAARLAAAAHCSVSYINHAFKKTVGMSLSEYIAEVRVSRAKKLLDSSNLPIKAIASNVGFDDTNYFSVVFKKIAGITPTEWRGRN